MKSSVAVLFFLGCALALASAHPCEFPHPGNGGVLNASGGYIAGSVMTWEDVSNCAKQWADPQGVSILENQWNDATRRFNVYMAQGNQAGSFAMLHQANNAFQAVAPHIRNPNLRNYFMETYTNFGRRLASGNIQAINQYMIDVHDAFKQAAQGLPAPPPPQ